jgi:hypothetical protein
MPSVMQQELGDLPMVSQSIFNSFHQELSDYIRSLTAQEFQTQMAIIQNEFHSQQVADNCTTIGKALELTEEELSMARLIAILHDIGRYTQILKKSNGENGSVVDHAETGIEIISNFDAFKELNEAEQRILTTTIWNHNKPEIPQKEDRYVLFYLQLLRDADKIDSMRITSEYLIDPKKKPSTIFGKKLANKPIVHKSVYDAIIKETIPPRDSIYTLYEYILFQLSWVFDINFRKSYHILNNKQYVKNLYKYLPKNDANINIYRIVKIYIDNKLF